MFRIERKIFSIDGADHQFELMLSIPNATNIQTSFWEQWAPREDIYALTTLVEDHGLKAFDGHGMLFNLDPPDWEKRFGPDVGPDQRALNIAAFNAFLNQGKLWCCNQPDIFTAQPAREPPMFLVLFEEEAGIRVQQYDATLDAFLLHADGDDGIALLAHYRRADVKVAVFEPRMA